ncbi:hypothetical protein XENOCAPTIV_026937 [Xenoophorus captivus]|uniref:Uncharacterized protein n=1 Tax=Xenoophorus captivus TaxID=1517983 RepID=A0ABV0RPC0_9TELE
MKARLGLQLRCESERRFVMVVTEEDGVTNQQEIRTGHLLIGPFRPSPKGCGSLAASMSRFTGKRGASRHPRLLSVSMATSRRAKREKDESEAAISAVSDGPASKIVY